MINLFPHTRMGEHITEPHPQILIVFSSENHKHKEYKRLKILLNKHNTLRGNECSKS